MSESQLAKNRYAYHQYEILEKLEAGIVLTGAEVKSARSHNINLKGAYCSIHGFQKEESKKQNKKTAMPKVKTEVLLKNCHISPYKPANDSKFNPTRDRKLLLNKKEISQLESQMDEHGLTLIPLSCYLKKGKIKIELGLGRGKKLHDKRQDLKRKDQQRQIEQHFRK